MFTFCFNFRKKWFWKCFFFFCLCFFITLISRLESLEQPSYKCTANIQYKTSFNQRFLIGIWPLYLLYSCLSPFLSLCVQCSLTFDLLRPFPNHQQSHAADQPPEETGLSHPRHSDRRLHHPPPALRLSLKHPGPIKTTSLKNKVGGGRTDLLCCGMGTIWDWARWLQGRGGSWSRRTLGPVLGRELLTPDVFSAAGPKDGLVVWGAALPTGEEGEPELKPDFKQIYR